MTSVADDVREQEKIDGGKKTQPNTNSTEGKENSAEDKYSFLIHYLNSLASKYTLPTNMNPAEQSEVLTENPGGMLKKTIKCPPSLG